MIKKSKTYFTRLIDMNSNYRKNLVIFLMLASVPGIIFSLALFYVSKSQMEKELHTVHQNSMNNTIHSIEEQFYELEMFMANWAAEINRKNFSDLNVTHEYEKIRELYKILIMSEGYNPLIGRVELFLNEPDTMIFTKNGYTYLEDEEKINGYNSLLANNKTLFWEDSHTSIERGYQNRYAPLSLVHQLDNHLFNPFGALIAFLDREKMANFLQSPYEDGSVFLLHGDNEWLFGEENQTEPLPLQTAILEEIQKQPSSSEPFMFEWNDTEYTVSYDHFNRLGENWHYVSIAPMSNITSPVVFISKLSIYLSVFVFMFAIILSLFASRKLYAPIEKLIKNTYGKQPIKAKSEFELIETTFQSLSSESKELEGRLKKHLPYLRKGYLLQLLQGYLYSYNEQDIQKQLAQYGSDAKNRKYAVVFIQIYGFNQVEQRFTEGDEGLVSFIAANIAEELMKSSETEADVINFHDLTLGILFSFSADSKEKEMDRKMLEFSDSFNDHFSQICKLQVSIGISRSADSLKSIPTIFEETKSALSFRNLQEKNQIIEMKKVDELTNVQSNFEYPFDIEKEVTHAIRLRDNEAAIKLLNEFFDKHTEQNVNEAILKQGALKLLGSIFHIVLQTTLIEGFVNKGAKLYEQLYKLKDPAEMNYWFKQKVILPIIEELTEKQDQRLHLIVQKVTEMLDDRYMEDISLEYCADQVNLNPSILSKVFKDITGWNFIDYLTNIRVQKAKELLIETDTKIKDIAENIGYQHSYFNRIFKKFEGVTPSQFREMSRKEQKDIV